MRARSASAVFDSRMVERCLAFADEALRNPPHWPHVRRVEARGDRIARFVLPLDICPPTNRTGRAGMATQAWRLAEIKTRALVTMLSQRARVRAPLPGRPLVRAVRFTPRETDQYADWAKIPIDCLCKKGIGLLRDDRPQDADVHQWCERSGPGQPRFVFIDVHSG